MVPELSPVVAGPLAGIRRLLGMVPRDPGLWVFGSSDGRRFADNAKWLYLHVVRDPPPGVRAVWVTRDDRVEQTLRGAGLPVARSDRMRGRWLTQRAGVWIFDSTVWDIGWWTSHGARMVNLWHGVQLKTVKLDIGNPNHPDRLVRSPNPRERRRARRRWPWAARAPDLMITTHPTSANRFASAFDVPVERVAVTGYPRNDALMRPVDDPTQDESIQSIREWAQEGPLVSYVPTFRQNATEGPGEAFPWAEVARVLEAAGARLMVKLHPRDAAAAPPPKLPRIHTIPPAADIAPLLGQTQVLITDYSSVYFDFLLRDRPILFFAYDLEAYKRDERPLYEAYEDAAPGPIAQTGPVLVEHLRQALAGQDTHAAKRAQIRARFHTHTDGAASARVVSEIRTRFGPR